MNSLKTLFVVAMLAAVAYGVYVTINNSPSTPPPEAPQDWSTSVDIQMPGLETESGLGPIGGDLAGGTPGAWPSDSMAPPFSATGDTAAPPFSASADSVAPPFSATGDIVSNGFNSVCVFQFKSVRIAAGVTVTVRGSLPLAITASEFDLNAQRAQSLGFDGYMLKPLEPEVLKKRLAAIANGPQGPGN